MFWFLIALIFFLLWITKKPKNVESDKQSLYDQGYWDGWRDFGKRVQSEITQENVSKEKLQSYINAGATGIVPPTNTYARPALDSTQPEHVPQVQAITIQQESLGTPVTSMLPEKKSPLEKEQVALKNLNTMLYVASFLLVAAAAAFIASNTPKEVRLILLWIVVGLFYGGGLTLYTLNTRLRPAAVSFVGTGLAILPFAGFALTLLADIPGQITWLITSLIGIVAYGIATVVLKQAVIAYMTLAFVLSLASSSTMALQLPLIWSFVAVMIVALLAHFIATLKSTVVPIVFARPIEQTGQYITPLALLASLFAITTLSVGEYCLIFALASLQYAVYWTQKRTYQNETIVRSLSLITFVLLGFTLAKDSALFVSIWMTALICVNALYSLIRVRLAELTSRNYESAWIIGSLTAFIMTITGWFQTDFAALGVTISLILISIIAATATIRLRQVEWAYICLGVSLALPYTVGNWLVIPHWPYETYPWIFLLASSAALAVYYYSSRIRKSEGVKLFYLTSFCTYTLVTTIAAIIAYSMPLSPWMAVIAAILATYCVILSYIYKHVAGEIVAIIYGIVAIGSTVWNTSADHTWHTLIIVGIVYAALLMVGLLHALRRETERMSWVLSIGQLAIGGFALGIAQDETRLVSSLLFTIAAIGATIRYIVVKGNNQLNILYAASTLPYLFVAWGATLLLEQGWQVLPLSIGAIIYWAISYRAAQPSIAIFANIISAGVVITLLQWLLPHNEWLPLLLGWTSAGIFILWYVLSLLRSDTQRAWIHVISFWLVLSATAIAHLFADKPISIAASLTMIILALSVSAHGYLAKKSIYIDWSILIFAFAVQWIIAVVAPETPAIVYGHVSALALVCVAFWRRRDARVRTGFYVAAAAVLTGGGAWSAFNDGVIYQLIFLVEHIIILIIGGLKQWQKVVWWGVGATVAAILYFLRDYFFLWLAFLGVVLIAIVIWRLGRMNKKTQ